MNTPDILAAFAPIVALFDRLGVGYSVVGSVASSAHGIARPTLDVDLVADLPGRLVGEIVEALEDAYYIDAAAASDAVRRRHRRMPTSLGSSTRSPGGCGGCSRAAACCRPGPTRPRETSLPIEYDHACL